MPRRVLDVRPKAQDDIRRLAEDNPKLPARISTLFHLLEGGMLTGEPLNEMARYGPLRDCYKVYFGAPGMAQNTYRIVHRLRIDGTIEVVEVIAVEERSGGYVYLLAADRLGRLPAESNPALKAEHQERIARRGAQRKARKRLS